MVQFLEECSERDDPRTDEMFSYEIAHFLKSYKIPNKFKNGLPGSHNCLLSLELNEI